MVIYWVNEEVVEVWYTIWQNMRPYNISSFFIEFWDSIWQRLIYIYITIDIECHIQFASIVLNVHQFSVHIVLQKTTISCIIVCTNTIHTISTTVYLCNGTNRKIFYQVCKFSWEHSILFIFEYYMTFWTKIYLVIVDGRYTSGKAILILWNFHIQRIEFSSFSVYFSNSSFSNSMGTIFDV